MIENPDTIQINLGYSFIIKGSDSLWVKDKLLLRESEYIIDYQRGILKLLREYSSPLTLRFLNFDGLRRNYSKWNEEGKMIYSKEFEEASSLQEELQIEGNKGLFFDFRSGRGDVTQSLWMKIGGRAGDFEVSGILSDENIPGGNDASQNLKEIDEIFIEAISPKISFRLGDITSEEEGVDKRLLGLSSKAGSFFGTVGITKSKFGKTTFKVTESKQGPYKIIPDEDIRDIVIISGSEKVWLNGKLLERGEGKDYIIDYSESSITFNPSVFLDNESVVLILFQYTSYEESNYFYKVGLKKDEYFVSFTQQKDISEKELIESYPDSGFGYRYTAVEVGEGNGDYELQDSIFVYVGPKKGSYEVYFNWVGEGRGEYIFVDSLHCFLWTGNGPYSPKKKVSLGEEDNLISLEIDKDFGRIKFSGNLKGRKSSTLLGNNEKEGLSTKVNLDFNPYDFIGFSLNYSKRFNNYVMKEWEGDKDLLKTWEVSEFPSEFLESSIKLNPYSKINFAYIYGEADTLRKDKINFSIFPYYIYYERIKDYKEDITTGFRFDTYDISYRNLKREKDYRKEFSLNIPYISLEYGLEGKGEMDTAKVYTIKTNLIQKIFSLSASQIYRKNLISGRLDKIINGSLKINFYKDYFSTRTQFDLSRKGISVWEKYYQKVLPGEGNYSFDSISNTYYENPFGDYIKRIVYTGIEKETKEYSANISINNEKLILLNGSLDLRYSPGLILISNVLLNFKFPEEGINKAFFRGDLKYSGGDPSLITTSQDYKKIDVGLERSSNGSREFGISREWNLKENKIGGFISFWSGKGVETKIEGVFIKGEDTLFSPIINIGYRPFKKGITGLIKIGIGYNYYYLDRNSISVRMKELYPPGLFYDLGSSTTFDFSNSLHFHLNTTIHSLSKGKIYYTIRVGATTNFNP